MVIYVTYFELPQKAQGKMALRTKFDLEKAIEVLLYIVSKANNTNKLNDVYRALKIIYFADKEHLYKYGRLICDDSYVAMNHGPVPSGCYDIIKLVRGDGYCFTDYPLEEVLSVEGNIITPQREADLELLSESDVECIDESINKYGNLSISALRRRSHDAAFRSADHNDFIIFENLAKSLPDGDQLLEYLANE